MGLLIDKTGRPIGYELFPGNTFEGETLEASLDKLSEKFGIRRVIIVIEQRIELKTKSKEYKRKRL